MQRLINKYLIACGLFSALYSSGFQVSGAPVEIRDAKFDEPKSFEATVPWIAPDDNEWKSAAPLFEVKDEEIELSARGWLAADSDYLYIRLIVSDTEHIAPFKSMLWSADGVELCIDARGDRSQGMGKDFEGTLGPDDVKFMAALTKEGPVLSCVLHKDPKKRGVMPEDSISITHDQEKDELTYEMRLPWKFFETRPGLYPTMGFAVQFNDLDAGQKEKNVLKWGEGTFGPFRPGLFNALKIASPAGEYVAMAMDQTILWEANEPGRAYLALKSSEPTQLVVNMGKERLEKTLAASDTMQRYEILLDPNDRNRTDQEFQITLSSKDKKLTEETAVLEFPAGLYQATIQRLESLMNQGGDPLFIRHLNSVHSLVMSEWARLALFRDADPVEAEVTRKAINNIYMGLEADAADWQTYVDGKRNLIFAYVSPHDRSVQYYKFAFPKNWDEEKAYPLFFELHGAGSENPLSGVATQMAPLENGEPRPATIASYERAGFFCQPFGRGNKGYRGIGEIDVWEAYDDVHRNFKIDPDRRYLYGFSMGGGGTWSIGTRTPDRWAALAIMAGGLWREQAHYGMAGNIAHMPIFLWCGEKDRLLASMRTMESLLKKEGADFVVKTMPDLGHNYHADIQKETYEWMQQFTRKRPDKFSYVSDTNEHTGAWGITMERDLTVSGLPRFEARIEDNTVHIDSYGTPGLRVDTGEKGLGLSGEVKIIWNGREAYKGDSSIVELGQPRRERRR